MSKLELHTSVDEILPCKDFPSITIKKINLGKKYYWTPTKSIYISSELPRDIRNRIEELKTKETIFETNKVIYKPQQYAALKNAIIENDDDKIRNIFKITQSLENKNLLISFSFSDFPNKNNFLGIKVFEDLLDKIHEIAPFVLVPHIRYSKSAKTSTRYEIKGFCKYVDNSLEILKEKNTKPLFVPFDLDYPQKVRDKILQHYAKNGYSNIWIDLKGKTISPISVLSKIRSLQRVANKLFKENANNLVFYINNPRKNSRQFGAGGILPSDILSLFTYSDFIGVPFKGIMGYAEDEEIWKKKGYSSKKEYEKELLKKESSIFNLNTYYYIYPNKIKFKHFSLEHLRKNILKKINSLKSVAKKISYSLNSFVILSEINQISKVIKNNAKLFEYIEDKEYFKNEGKIIIDKIKSSKDKIKRKESKSLFEFVNI